MNVDDASFCQKCGRELNQKSHETQRVEAPEIKKGSVIVDLIKRIGAIFAGIIGLAVLALVVLLVGGAMGVFFAIVGYGLGLSAIGMPLFILGFFVGGIGIIYYGFIGSKNRDNKGLPWNKKHN